LKYYADGKTISTPICADGDWTVPDQNYTDDGTPTITVGTACADGLPCCADGWWLSAARSDISSCIWPCLPLLNNVPRDALITNKARAYWTRGVFI
jgi:hypothetical protein